MKGLLLAVALIYGQMAAQAPLNNRVAPKPPESPFAKGGTTAVASYYGEKHQGKLTANGERFDRWGMTCAHKSLPFNTWLIIRNPENGRTAMVRVNDRGPYVKGREFDLSEGAYRQVAKGNEHKGVLKLEWRRVR
jgi:rare lipoprotein A